jgi:hypothetical protein
MAFFDSAIAVGVTDSSALSTGSTMIEATSRARFDMAAQQRKQTSTI